MQRLSAFPITAAVRVGTPRCGLGTSKQCQGLLLQGTVGMDWVERFFTFMTSVSVIGLVVAIGWLVLFR